MSASGSADSYDTNAEFWVKIIRERLDRYRTELTDQAVLDAIGPCQGKRVLDAGCGEGYLSRELARAGARVTGLDASAALIQAAVQERDAVRLDIDHYVAVIESFPEDDDTFDIVVCNHLMTDLADPGPALKEIGRVTKAGGKLIILMLHPCFYTANSERHGEHASLPADLYFSTRTVTQPFRVAGINSPGTVTNTLRPLEEYTQCQGEGAVRGRCLPRDDLRVDVRRVTAARCMAVARLSGRVRRVQPG